jgi:hypothetical protein
MVPSFIVAPSSQLVWIVYHDTPNFAEWVEMMAAISLDPKYRPGFSFLVDRRAVADPSPLFSRRFADYLARHSQELGVAVHAAIIVAPEAFAATEAMLRLCPDSSRMRTFRDPVEAERWISETVEPGAASPSTAAAA